MIHHEITAIACITQQWMTKPWDSAGEIKQIIKNLLQIIVNNMCSFWKCFFFEAYFKVSLTYRDVVILLNWKVCYGQVYTPSTDRTQRFDTILLIICVPFVACSLFISPSTARLNNSAVVQVKAHVTEETYLLCIAEGDVTCTVFGAAQQWAEGWEQIVTSIEEQLSLSMPLSTSW